ncbi:hypothetical protein E8E14_002514 [Neopestalotiopsis sp. 37M]|nr:hypothetical protein E8E14_002514 [Neopestalotiopsis sp. 37M]
MYYCIRLRTLPRYFRAEKYITFPGIPIYASEDLINWRLASHVWSRDSQLQGISWNTTATQGGLYAPTLRFHDGVFYVASVYIVSTVDIDVFGAVFKSADPFDIDGWSDPARFDTSWRIDPDLFWDDDGTLYVTTSGILLQTLDLDTGEVGESVSIWNGTGGESPEGPHIYKKDGWYYLIIAEGGTALNHSVTIARSENITGPYNTYDQNPILTNRGTDEYFQTVGHADLFQDTNGNWWGMCLSTRSGPDYEVYPMGREAALFAVSWDVGSWPVLEPVRGTMSGWELPVAPSNVTVRGVLNSAPDVYDFNTSSDSPLNFVYPRLPPSTVVMSDDGQHGISFISRAQTDTIFQFSVDMLFNPQAVQEEAGVSIFLTQYDHIDLGIVLLDTTNQTTIQRSKCDANTRMYFHFNTQSTINGETSQLSPVPESWAAHAIRLEILSSNSTYTFFASSVSDLSSQITIGEAAATIYRWNLLNGLLFFWHIVLTGSDDEKLYFAAQARKNKPIAKQRRLEQAVVFGTSAVLLFFDWRRWMWFALLPQFYAKYCILSLNMLQHDGCDTSSKYNFARNFTDPLLNWLCFNNGFHTIHHLYPGLHWSVLPEKHRELIAPYISSTLEEPSILAYMWRSFIWPGIRLDFRGQPLVITKEEMDMEDEPWLYEQDETYSSTKEYLAEGMN